jgi:hypothetical protein
MSLPPVPPEPCLFEHKTILLSLLTSQHSSKAQRTQDLRPLSPYTPNTSENATQKEDLVINVFKTPAYSFYVLHVGFMVYRGGEMSQW